MYRTASVELLEDNHTRTCEVCVALQRTPASEARYNVFDGNGTVYTCGNHMCMALNTVATRKGTN